MVFIYEDDQWRNLLPLVHLRPVFDLRCGCRTLLEKYQVLYPREKLGLLVRPELTALTAEQHPKLQIGTVGQVRLVRPSETSVLFLSGRSILDRPLPVRGPEEVFVNGNEIVGFRVNPARLRSSSHQPPATRDRRKLLGQPLFSEAEKGTVPSFRVRSWHLPERKVLASIVEFPWNLVEFNESELVRELKWPGSRTVKWPGVDIIGNPRNLRLARGALVEPGVVFDLRLGGILIDEQARVRTRSVIAGPCYIGKGTVIDAALIRPGCSFGPECRIGGEVEASIFLGHANKHHEGFIGHAVVGEWVNLGALTTNSDLRNDYGEVRVLLPGSTQFGMRNADFGIPHSTFRNPQYVNTTLRKFGCVIGDHAKTAIGSLLNTGAVLGIFANWFEPGLSPKLIPDFARGSRGRGPLEELVETARIVMSRRGARLSPDYEQLVRRIYARK